ncbi:MAG: helix-turn-helix domain-containing protein [Lachnospiraceae bacterium]|nr:helix-turn-helix domain-containing protein [Lachnospiraceae bacterium]
MYEKIFASRLTQLRMEKGVSARDMSLSLGQNPGYINGIENGKTLPSMTVFFYICEYLDITPETFFEIDNECPEHLNKLMKYSKQLTPIQLEHITSVVKDLIDSE